MPEQRLDRRSFLASAAGVATAGAQVPDASQRPNILHIMTDQQTTFIEYWEAVDAAMLTFFGIDTSDAGIDESLIANAQEECQTPEDFARWHGESSAGLLPAC